MGVTSSRQRVYKQLEAPARSVQVSVPDKLVPPSDTGNTLPPDEPRGCFDTYKGFVAAVFLSTLTAALFLLRSGPLASSTCSNVVMLYTEAIKFCVAIVYVLRRGQASRITHSVLIACVPVTSYVIVNLLSFWALKYVHASLGALMSQVRASPESS
jgi:hypothetical protein